MLTNQDIADRIRATAKRLQPDSAEANSLYNLASQIEIQNAPLTTCEHTMHYYDNGLRYGSKDAENERCNVTRN